MYRRVLLRNLRQMAKLQIATVLREKNLGCICGHTWEIHGYRLDIDQRGLGAFDCNAITVGLGYCECLDFKEIK